MKTFHSLPVKEIRQETSDSRSLVFDIPPELKSAFSYQQGQYLTLKASIGGEEVRRSYSLCSSPLDEEWRVAVKWIPCGIFSGYVHENLEVGDKLEVMVPNGRFFTEIDPQASRTHAAFAAGSGITPILSIIKTHLALEPNSSFKLFFANKRVSSIMLKEEIEGLKNTYLDRFEVFHFLTEEERSIAMFNGRIDGEKLRQIEGILFDSGAIDHFFLCGPEAMIFTIRDFLLEKKVDPKQIHFELFKSSGGNGKIEKRKVSQHKNQAKSDVHILEGGKSFKFSVPQGSISILDAALQRDADLPFACKGGVCCTCRARLIEGEVDMQVNYALEAEEVEQGYILSCQAIPISEKVVVDFDA